jgi:SAM-dependent methyltransferase
VIGEKIKGMMSTNGNDPFLAPSSRRGNLDRFIVRAAILRELQLALPSFRGRVLDVGCGQKPYRSLILRPPSQAKEYVGLDMQTARYGVEPDVSWDGRHMPFEDESFDFALATEVLEHCPEPIQMLREVCRILRPGGGLFFTVPFVWPLHEVPHDEFRYTPFAMERILRDSGFDRICLKALGGWDASLAQLLGLWVRRRPMSGWKRSILSRLLAPFIRWLARRDDRAVEFKENAMISGLAGIATKP